MSMNVDFNNSNYTNYYAKNTSQNSEAIGKHANLQNYVENQASDIWKNKETGLAKKTGETECKTCASRKYVDKSLDPGVSFKTPTHVSPQASSSAVMSHEQEHVSNGLAKAQSDGRKVVSQSVQIYTDVCPECGRVYTSGGKTTTITKSVNGGGDYFLNKMKKFFEGKNGKYIDVKV